MKQLVRRDNFGRTIPQLAALSGSTETFVAVLDACKAHEFSNTKVGTLDA